MKSKLNSYIRYQKGLVLEDIFPTRQDKTCACGCGSILTGRKKKWASKKCLKSALLDFFIIKGDVSVIRSELFKIDRGYCRTCGKYDIDWQADHIKPVFLGGGACSIQNFQTLCLCCHKQKTKLLYSIPDSNYILTSRFYVIQLPFYTFGTFNKGICKNIVRNKVSIS